MQALTPEFVESCPEVGGFRQRGLEMTRVEVFVDAAFAFAVTMLVISFDQIPASFEEMVVAIKGIPAFVVAVAQLVWIWYEHNRWSRIFGLDDVPTVVLSAALLTVVLIYIYPLRIMAQGMFSWFTGGYLPTSFNLGAYFELRFMFVFMGTGFTALCLIFFLLYLRASQCREPLLLSECEHYDTVTTQQVWLGFAIIGLLSVALALTLPDRYVPFSGFAYCLLGFWGPFLPRRRDAQRPDCG